MMIADTLSYDFRLSARFSISSEDFPQSSWMLWHWPSMLFM